ncbi:MAG: GyrI-like domain-containing protein [Saccharofermentanales bacterium]
MSETSQPKFQVFTTKIDEYYVLGHSFKDIDHGRLGEYYEKFEKDKPLRDFAAKFSTPDNRLVGIVCDQDFIAGAIVEGVTEAPEGAELMKFPASEFLVITHDFTGTEPECYPFIGMTVSYAHSRDVRIPDGYERYHEPNGYMERYNFNYEENKFRTEVWFAIRNIYELQ